MIRRLSKVEYGNTLHDLYGVDPSIADSLPEEVVGEGYLNSISPLQSELFLDIANKVIDQVVAPRVSRPPKFRNACSGRRRPKTPIFRRTGGGARSRALWLAMLTAGRPPRQSWMCWWASLILAARTS